MSNEQSDEPKQFLCPGLSSEAVKLRFEVFLALCSLLVTSVTYVAALNARITFLELEQARLCGSLERKDPSLSCTKFK